MDCSKISSALGCHNGDNVVVHYKYGAHGEAPEVRITNLAGAILPAADLSNTTLGACPLPGVSYLFFRATGPQTVNAPYRSVSFTAFSADCTINGEPVPAGFSWTVSGEGAATVSDDAEFDGTDYTYTVVL